MCNPFAKPFFQKRRPALLPVNSGTTLLLFLGIAWGIFLAAPRFVISAPQVDPMTDPPATTVPKTPGPQEIAPQPQDEKASATPGAQDNPQPEGGFQAVRAFRELIGKIKTNRKKIDQLYSSIPIGFPKLQKERMLKITALEAENEKLMAQKNDAALASFLAAPNQDPEATRVIFDLISMKLDGNTPTPYDPKGALKLANLMLENGVEAPQIVYQAFRASFNLNDFEGAKKKLDKLESLGAKLDDSIVAQLNDSQVKWERELKIRDEEAKADDLPRVKFETTEGDFVVELYENEAPQTVANFISLVESKFYDGLDFYLVRPGFYARTGCPQGDGSADAGYKIPDELDRDELRYHFAGTLSMVTNGKDTGSSQFIISHQANRNFDGKYTVFGRIVEGFDNALKLKAYNPETPGMIHDKPSTIKRVTVLRKRNHKYVPTLIKKEASSFLPNNLPGLIQGDTQGSGSNDGSDNKNGSGSR